MSSSAVQAAISKNKFIIFGEAKFVCMCEVTVVKVRIKLQTGRNKMTTFVSFLSAVLLYYNNILDNTQVPG